MNIEISQKYSNLSHEATFFPVGTAPFSLRSWAP